MVGRDIFLTEALTSTLGVNGVASVHTRRTNPYNSDVSTADTIENMRALVLRSAGTPIVRQATQDALARLGPNSPTQNKVNALFWYVKRTVRFTTDEEKVSQALGIPTEDKELLISPDVLLQMPQPMGDCDDFSMLLAAMLVSSGIPVDVYFTTVAVDDMEPNRWSHVFVKTVFMDGDREKVYCLDASHGAYPGWSTDGIHRLKDWPVSEGNTMRVYTREEITALGQERLGYSGLSGDGMGIAWGPIVERSIDTGLNIATGLTDPRFRRGTFSQRGPDGSEIIQRSEGAPTFGVSSFPAGSGFNQDIIKWGVVILGVGAVMMFARK